MKNMLRGTVYGKSRSPLWLLPVLFIPLYSWFLGPHVLSIPLDQKLATKSMKSAEASGLRACRLDMLPCRTPTPAFRGVPPLPLRAIGSGG